MLSRLKTAKMSNFFYWLNTDPINPKKKTLFVLAVGQIYMLAGLSLPTSALELIKEAIYKLKLNITKQNFHYFIPKAFKILTFLHFYFFSFVA